MPNAGAGPGNLPVNTFVQWSPGGKYIASAVDTVQVWDAVSGITLVSYQGHNHSGYESVTAVAWSPGGKLIASPGFDATVQVWKAR